MLLLPQGHAAWAAAWAAAKVPVAWVSAQAAAWDLGARQAWVLGTLWDQGDRDQGASTQVAAAVGRTAAAVARAQGIAYAVAAEGAVVVFAAANASAAAAETAHQPVVVGQNQAGSQGLCM